MKDILSLDIYHDKVCVPNQYSSCWKHTAHQRNIHQRVEWSIDINRRLSHKQQKCAIKCTLGQNRREITVKIMVKRYVCDGFEMSYDCCLFIIESYFYFYFTHLSTSLYFTFLRLSYLWLYRLASILLLLFECVFLFFFFESIKVTKAQKKEKRIK